MRKIIILAVMPVFFLFISFLSGCSKPGWNPPPRNGGSLCDIKRISFLAPSGFRDTITFLYNAKGNPISGDRVIVGTGSPRYLFRYDKQDRLQDFIGAYNNGAAEFWTRYSYSSDNRTVYDTTYTLVSNIINWPPAPPYGEFTTLIKKYDQKGRLSQISYSDYPNVTVVDFTYDTNGNLEGGGYTYDNKVNYHQTNKIWMFVDDQYSVNNPFPINAYNTFGLPVKINYGLNPLNPTYNPVLFGLSYPQTVIAYDCEAPIFK